MPYIEKTGSLFESTADAYAHGVNTEGVMGAGIAVLFRQAYPHMYDVYRRLCRDRALKPGHLFTWEDKDRTIYNIASQDLPGPYARIEWYESGLLEMLDLACERGVDTIAMPRIGCGIGGLRWESVQSVTELYASQSKVLIEVWTP